MRFAPWRKQRELRRKSSPGRGAVSFGEHSHMWGLQPFRNARTSLTSLWEFLHECAPLLQTPRRLLRVREEGLNPTRITVFPLLTTYIAVCSHSSIQSNPNPFGIHFAPLLHQFTSDSLCRIPVDSTVRNPSSARRLASPPNLERFAAPRATRIRNELWRDPVSKSTGT